MKNQIIKKQPVFLFLIFSIFAPFHWTQADTEPNSTPTVSLPICEDEHGANLPVNNTEVENWKSTTRNQFLARAHILGKVGRIFPKIHGHDHFEAILGPNPGDTIEVIYNISFGKLPLITNGMKVEACGDYITSNAPTSEYPASPDSAIIHWIHRSPKNERHPSGYLALDGILYGQGAGEGS